MQSRNPCLRLSGKSLLLMRDTTIDLARLDGGEIKDNGDRGYL
ncbi:MAG: hypothetical protein PVG94_04320 [Gammaproteobacteria bacterium]